MEGKIKFTENGFILERNTGEVEIWELGTDLNPHFIYFNGNRYKWKNPPKQSSKLDDEDC